MKLAISPTRLVPFLAAPLLAGALGWMVAVYRAPVRGAAAAATPAYAARKLCDLSDARIDESSGVGASRRYPGYLWTHNDSGDGARLFLVSLEGKTASQVDLVGATAWDWEDMAVAGTGADAWVYIGDIGDNFELRSNITVYRFREPALDLNKPPGLLKVECERLRLSYPDGAHNAEALLATADGYLLIVTKSEQGSVIFKTPQPFTAKGAQTLVRVGKYSFGTPGKNSALVTGGDLSPDGQRLVICTYGSVYEWTLPSDDPWKSVWKSTPQTSAMPPGKQNEAICYSADGRRLFTTSEGRPTPLHELAPPISALAR